MALIVVRWCASEPSLSQIPFGCWAQCYRNHWVIVRGWCPVDRKMVDVLVSTHRISLPKSETVTNYWCKECTASIEPENVSDDDQTDLRMV